MVRSSNKRGRGKGGGGGERNVRRKGPKEEAPADPDSASGKGGTHGRKDPKEEEAPVDPNPGRKYAPQLPAAANPKPAAGDRGILGRKGPKPKEADALVHPNLRMVDVQTSPEAADQKANSAKRGTSGRMEPDSPPPAATGNLPLTMDDKKGELHMVLPKKDRGLEAFGGHQLRKKDKRNVVSDSSPSGSNASDFSSNPSDGKRTYASGSNASDFSSNPSDGKRTYARVATEVILRERAAGTNGKDLVTTAVPRRRMEDKRAPLNSENMAASETSVSESNASSSSASGSTSSTASRPKSYSRNASEAILQERAAADAKRAAAEAKRADEMLRQRIVADAIAGARASSSIPKCGTVPERFMQFLQSFVKRGDIAAYYPAYVGSMKARQNFVLEISFQDLLTFSLELGMLIANNTRSELLLLPTVRKFLVDCGLAAIGDVNQKASLIFSGKPHNITPLRNFFNQGWHALVKEFKDIFREGHYATTLANLTIALYGGYLGQIVDTWGLNLSYGGDFDIGDMVVVNNNQYIITKKPKILLGADKEARIHAKRADVRRLEQIFTPELDGSKLVERHGQPFQDSDLPLFYPEFRDVLRGIGTEGDVDKEWFPDFILHFPCLKLPDTRHDFVCDSYLLLEQPTPEIAAEILTKAPLPSRDRRNYPSWQADIATSDIKVLTDVYFHRIDGKAKEGGPAVGSLCVYERDLFAWEIGGIIKYDRHLLQHAYKTILMSSLAEVEVFASKKLLPYLPHFLKLMLDNGLMKGIFLGTWEEYKMSRIRTTDGLEPNTGPRLQFWDMNLEAEDFPKLQAE